MIYITNVTTANDTLSCRVRQRTEQTQQMNTERQTDNANKHTLNKSSKKQISKHYKTK